MCLYKFEKEDLKPSVIVINGAQGHGKTSLMCSIMANNYKYHGKERFLNSLNLLNSRVNPYRDEKLTPDNVLYFSNFDCLLDLKHGVHTHFVDKYDIAVLNDDKAFTQAFPPYSVVAFTEADKVFNCRDFTATGKTKDNEWLKYIKDFVYMFFATLRHNMITLILDYQVFERLDASLRNLVTDNILILHKYDVPKGFFRREKQIFDILWTFPQNESYFERLSKIGYTPPKNEIAQRHRYRFIGNIHDHYDSFCYMPLYYYNLTEYAYKEQPTCDYSLEGIAEYRRKIYNA